MTSALPKASTILASLGQAAFVWDIATDAITWSDHAGAVFSDIPAASLASGAEFSKLIEPQRTIRSDALLHSPPAPRRRGRAVPDRIWRADLDLGARALDRGNRLLVRRSRRQAGARAGHRPHQQRAPRPRRAAVAAVAARSPDRRVQPDPSDRGAGGSHRGSHAVPHLLRLHADRHRSSGAHQRRLRLRRCGRRDFRSGEAHPHRACAAATCSAGFPATSSG